jgi:hypothetical protein
MFGKRLQWGDTGQDTDRVGLNYKLNFFDGYQITQVIYFT